MKTWLGYEKTEKIGEDHWNAKIYEVAGFDLKISSLYYCDVVTFD